MWVDGEFMSEEDMKDELGFKELLDAKSSFNTLLLYV